MKDEEGGLGPKPANNVLVLILGLCQTGFRKAVLAGIPVMQVRNFSQVLLQNQGRCNMGSGSSCV